ncbi:MAG: FKBP-type peptidyl-prolyl cis-trans isomerase [Bacteroidota bacterium]
MKKIIILSTCLLVLVSASFAQKPVLTAKQKAAEDTIQYSLGVYMMQQFFAKTGFVVNDPVLFTKAINDVIAKRKLMVDPASTQNRLFAYQNVYLLEKGKQLEALLFNKVRAEKGYTATASGVYFAVAKQGGGLRPSEKDTVVLNVVCTLPDGTEIDNSNKTKQSYMAIAGEMIPGLKDVLYRVGAGSVFRAILPAQQAYGERGTTAGVPPNSALIYDVAVVSVRPAK